MTKKLIKGAQVVNEGTTSKQDVLIEGMRIAEVSSSIAPTADMDIIEAHGKYLLPGCIDDQVHFREPGLTHKATIGTESKACLAGGITSFLEMPNTNPQTTTSSSLCFVKIASTSTTKAWKQKEKIGVPNSGLFRIFAQTLFMSQYDIIVLGSGPGGYVTAMKKCRRAASCMWS